MANESCSSGINSSQVVSDSSQSSIEIKIKTLDSQTYSLRVNKNMPVPTLKEKIMSAIGVPLNQQRLIYKGKVLKDDQLLSEYHMEDGDTLHLVVRQPGQSQPTSSTSGADTSSSNANHSGSGVQRNRVGQVAHSFYFGTVNVPDRPGETVAADISRIIGTVINSLGAATMGQTVGPIPAPSVSVVGESNQNSTGARDERPQSSNRISPSISTHEGVVLLNHPLQSSIQLSQSPFPGAVFPQMVIPDALTTLSEFISRMELLLQSSTNSHGSAQLQPRLQTSSLDARGLPTPELLRSVMDQAQHLLRDNAAAALSHVSERLEREGGSSDPAVRGQIQAEAMQLGVAMQHLGAMLLELGRAIMTLRIGQSSEEYSVNTGPAVYISAMGPNPIMVQPFPFQPSSLFSLSSPPFVTGVSGGGPSNNVNIHINAGSSVAFGSSSSGSMTSVGEGIPENHSSTEQVQTTQNVNDSRNSSTTRGVPARTVVAAIPAGAVPEAAGHVLSFMYPVQIRGQQSVLVNSIPQSSGSTPSRGQHPHEQSSVISPPAGYDSAAMLVAQITARIANNIHSNAAEGSHAATSGDTQSDMFSSTLQSSQINSNITLPSQLNEQRDGTLSGDPTSYNSVSGLQSNEGSRIGQSNESACQSDQLSVNTRERNEIDGRYHVSDLSVSGNEDCQIKTEVLHSSIVEPSTGAEEPVAISSSKAPVDYQPGDISFGVSNTESSKNEPDSVELPQVSCMTAPLGLGFGGLHTKKRSKTVRTKGKDDEQTEAPMSNQSQHSVPHSLGSQTSTGGTENANGSFSGLPSLFSQLMDAIPSGEQAGGRQTDLAGMMTTALQSPAFNSLLSGVASQSRVPAGNFRNLLEQCAKSPAVQNTVNQLVQQVGQSRDQGGQDRFNFSGMIQQMLPVVSEALGRAPTSSASTEDTQSEPPSYSNDVGSCATESVHDAKYQIDLSRTLERIEQHDNATRIFQSLVETAGHIYGEEFSYEDIAELGNNEELANEFLEVLRQDIRLRLEKARSRE
ncbi:Ubiquitin-40S ribosomal protein S27a [Apostasia shenzhenica]|uniref:Ubiquitin-40S ribosomal protein S27a n=1 Tax=Apostasia shenzhenica TaxID=1088818 RepID=A0A2I0AX68_9ASPA|nr:Ubiquitin-40S ribosomal protein S27a [Apostasia shenzhenica]